MTTRKKILLVTVMMELCCLNSFMKCQEESYCSNCQGQDVPKCRSHNMEDLPPSTVSLSYLQSLLKTQLYLNNVSYIFQVFYSTVKSDVDLHLFSLNRIQQLHLCPSAGISNFSHKIKLIRLT